MAFLRGITTLLFSPVAGVIVERLHRRRLVAFTQTVPAVVSLLIGLLVTTGWAEVCHLCVMAVTVGGDVALSVRARQVLIYDVVGAQHLTSAIALNSVTGNVSRIVAPSLEGALAFSEVLLDSAIDTNASKRTRNVD